MDSNITAAIIAGIISLIISLITSITTIIQVRSERKKVEKQLERQFTERLYNMRLKYYPQLFKISSDLGKENSPQQVMEILSRLKDCKEGYVSLIWSQRSKEAFYNLQEAMKKHPETASGYSDDQIARLWRLRNLLRGELRRDIGLLFTEDEIE